ncbi:MAG: enoyl-CoA hydratase-related protein [Pseudomonadota bacterium]|nr:enoyl-CoA hydratase-related protein [Pseudomonadota bacterium]
MGPQLVDYLLYEKEDNGILWVKFNRPEKMNALYGTAENNGTVAKVGEYMRAADDDPDVRVIVLTGVGRGFCSGADLKERPNEDEIGPNIEGARGAHEGPDAMRQHFYHGFTKLHRDISVIRKPTIAMINGAAVGSGMDMSLHCDIRIGCEKTRFIGYQQAGQIMENGGSYYLPKMVGLGRALEFAYTGSLDAERAYEWGLLNHLVSSEELEQTTRALCDRIIALPPLVQWTSKRIMRAAMDSTLETTMVLTSNAGGILQSSADAKEARQAFVEKRKPDFKGV